MTDSQDELLMTIGFVKNATNAVIDFSKEFKYVDLCKNGWCSEFLDATKPMKKLFELHLPHNGIDFPHIAVESKKFITKVSGKYYFNGGKVMNTLKENATGVLGAINIGTAVFQDIVNGEISMNTVEAAVDTSVRVVFDKFVKNAKAGAIAGDCVALGFAIIKDWKSGKAEETREVARGIVGRRAGEYVGGIIGTAIGTSCFGPSGTVIGGIAGKVIGGIVGSYVVPKIFEALRDPVKVVNDVAKDVDTCIKICAKICRFMTFWTF